MKLIIFFMFCFFCNSQSDTNYNKQSFYDHKAEMINGEFLDFSSLKGKKVLIVNTASYCGLTSQYLLTNTEKHTSELENPLVLIVSSEIPNVRKIQGVLEHVIKKGRALLIVAPLATSVKQALTMNKVKGNIKVNVIDLPGFGPTKRETVEEERLGRRMNKPSIKL